MTVRRNGVSFAVFLRERASMDQVAREVADALAVTLVESRERGLRDDFVGDVAGLGLWLRMMEAATSDSPPRIAFLGLPTDEFEPEADWISISTYVAELLTARTGRTWEHGPG